MRGCNLMFGLWKTILMLRKIWKLLRQNIKRTNQFRYMRHTRRSQTNDNVMRIDRRLILISAYSTWSSRDAVTDSKGMKWNCVCFPSCCCRIFRHKSLAVIFGSLHVSSVYQLINMITCRVHIQTHTERDTYAISRDHSHTLVRWLWYASI